MLDDSPGGKVVTVPVTVVVYVGGPLPGEGQAMSSRDAANTASDSPAGVNRPLKAACFLEDIRLLLAEMVIVILPRGLGL